jgi:hypothetical protein
MQPLSIAEHARKCLKVEYLGRIEYDFQKTRVTGPRDHKVSVSAKKVKKKFHACVPLNVYKYGLSTEPKFLNFVGPQESIPTNQIPPGCEAWRAGTTTLFLLGS